MDPLTHALTGVMIARVAFRNRVPRAELLCAAAAVIPDVDLLSLALGPLTFAGFHRGATHSWLLAPALAAAVVAVARTFVKVPLGWGFAAALAGVASHLVLDWGGTFGVRWFWPWSESWYGLYIFPMLDLVPLTILAVGMAAPALSGLISDEIGARGGQRGRGAAIFALVVLALYGGARWEMRNRAMNLLESRIYDGAVPRRTMAVAATMNPLRWRGLVETPLFSADIPVRLWREFDPDSGEKIYAPESPAVEAARRTATAARFGGFSRWPVWRVTPAAEPEGANIVTLQDLVFGNEPGQFEARMTVDASGRVLGESFTLGRWPLP